jgi:hypothetical protein
MAHPLNSPGSAFKTTDAEMGCDRPPTSSAMPDPWTGRGYPLPDIAAIVVSNVFQFEI